MLSTIVTGIAGELDREMQTVCKSTEEMLHEIEKVNSKEGIKDICVFSTDVAAMFPSLDIDVVARVAAEEYLASKLEVDMDWEELSLYLAVTMDREELVSRGLGEVTHTRVHKHGPKPGITGSKLKSKFHKPTQVPTQQQQRIMFSMALEHLIKISMKNHTYTFNKEIKLQSSGGAIGLTLTGSLAVLYMLRWCKEFLAKVRDATSDLNGFELHMLKYYIDDGNTICSILPPGSRLVDGKIVVVEREVEADIEVPGDERTANIFLEIGNSVSEFIKLTADFPSKHESGWMPLLDVQVRVRDNQVEHKFYKKDVSNPLLMLANSAMPMKVKRNSLAQEGIRRLRNTSRHLPWELKADILSEFSHKLMLSGYDEKFRLDIIKSAVTGYERQVERADNGGTPLYRARTYQEGERRKKKLLTKTSWYRPSDAVIFVPPTPRSELAKQIQEVVTEEGSRIGMAIKVVETGGKSLKQHLVRMDLTGCYYPDCPLCESGKVGASHTRSGVHYSGVCKLCADQGRTAMYNGESGRSGYYRMKQHVSEISNNKTSNAFAKYLELYHKNEARKPESFVFKSEGVFRKCLERQVTEGIHITHTPTDILMNSKSEYLQPAVTRITTTREVRSCGS